MTETLLDVQSMSMHITTPLGVVKPVDDVSLSIKRGEILAVVGESGSGKSMTGLTILGLHPQPQAKIMGGSIQWKGHELVGASEEDLRKLRGQEIAMIFQDPMTSLNPVYTVGVQIVEMIRAHQQVSIDKARTQAIEVLGLVGIPQPDQRVDSFPHELSGGMRQRAMVAMAIANDPDLLIADEPTTALDVTVQAQVLELLQSIQERTGCAILLITHDLGVVAGVADRVLVMYGGKVVESGITDEIFYGSHHPYTRGLLHSLPNAAQSRLEPIPGQPPSLLHLPSGCSFHPRCSFAHLPDPCSVQIPELRKYGQTLQAACHFAREVGESK